jgi:plasmid stabilization system protein ParE
MATDTISAAARRWLEGLDDRQRAEASFAFEDAERFSWHYVPGERKGVSLRQMTPAQRGLAFGIVDAAMSARGASELRSVVDLELILGEIEGRSDYRDPGRYWFAIFGEPGGDAAWSWRIGGHHVAIHGTLARGVVVGATPSFLGANPATVPSGPSAGRRAIDGEERLARELLASLTGSQRKVAVVDPSAPPDIVSGTGRRADPRDIPAGIRADALEAGQRQRLEDLIRHYVDRFEPATAEAAWRRIEAAGLDGVTFAWCGSDQPGRGHYYAVRSPALLIEYDNTQNGANHIHSVWREPANDWGEDLLAAHYRSAGRAS